MESRTTRYCRYGMESWTFYLGHLWPRTAQLYPEGPPQHRGNGSVLYLAIDVPWGTMRNIHGELLDWIRLDWECMSVTHCMISGS